MQAIKKTIGQLEKCYALSRLTVQGRECFLAAAEKHAPCYLFDLAGNRLETVWEEPGGVMTMVPVPETDGVFLATHQFYSPNDSAQARLVCASREPEGWQVRTIAQLPFVHRFDIIRRGGVNYVLACTLKSDHREKNDWRFPGKLWTGVLSEDPSAPLALTVLREGLTHNHGYTRCEENGVVSGVVSSDEGVFLVTPPERPEGQWTVKQLLDQPCSDAVRLDLDGDGVPELLTISPFHGDQIAVWRLEGGRYAKVYHHPWKLPFLHAITGGEVYGRPTVYVGHREGERLLLGFYYDRSAGEYRWEELDRGCGAANCMLVERQGRPALVAANREINEIAVYDIVP